MAPHEPTRLTVLYDPKCSLCCRARYWLVAQPKYVPLEFIGAGTDRAQQRFPELDPQDTLDNLVVVDSAGAVYRGPKAWLICLWALRRYRSWALTIGSPALLPSARRFIDWVSRHRKRFGIAGSSN